MNEILTNLDELGVRLRRLRMKHSDSKRLDGQDYNKLSKQENDRARRTAVLFFEYEGAVWGLTGDTTFEAADRFKENLRLFNAKSQGYIFKKGATKKSRRPCLHLGNTKSEPNGWYCYEAEYFVNWNDQALAKAA